MYLEKLKIQGFKSFAHRNELTFPGLIGKSKRGITAVVGPNGSGKSNVADAVRWALGEQSMKTLRGKKSEDVIFSGSDKKGKLGMAEVSLFLNNENKTAPIDYTQLVLTRRLYRNGESEYILNNSRVRLSDIQMLLAKAKFGQKTYSVIGQGMVEGFLNTSLAERKEFFDEATGVKQYQIKRDDSLNKLRSSYENLSQAQMLLTEIEPRLKSLTRQVNKLRKRGELEKQMKELQLNYYSRLWREINKNFQKYNFEYLELEKTKILNDKKLDRFNQELEKLKKESSGYNNYSEWQNALAQKQAEKEELNKKIAKMEAEAEIKLEANGQFEVSFLINKKQELEKAAHNTEEEIKALENNIKILKNKEDEQNKKKQELDKKINSLNNRFVSLSKNNGHGHLSQINKKMNIMLGKLRQANIEDNLERIKKIITEIKTEVKNIIKLSQGEMETEDIQKLPEELKRLAQEKEVLTNKISENNFRLTAYTERVKLLKEKNDDLTNEKSRLKAKLEKSAGHISVEETIKEQKDLENKLSLIEKEMAAIRQKINDLSLKEENSRLQLFALQNNIQTTQNELNVINQKLNEIKINSARFETKLENLEMEIREEYGRLKEIKENKAVNESLNEDDKEKINALKKQLELIGGIDPEIEKEYTETKERYDFLFGQADDLNEAIKSLEKIIKELDITIKEQFDKEFKIISKKFEEYFKILFSGGAAKILKVMLKEKEEEEEKASDQPEDDSDSKLVELKKQEGVIDVKKIKFLQKHNATGLAGIEIQACPPGKKIKSIAMLSGGERALTAIAMICAIISANPSPFVVLDEVDAALDEANSERLAKILDELSHKTQFIIITHNRASMRKANILYGVTMGDDGISKLLSIKLEDAKAKN